MTCLGYTQISVSNVPTFFIVGHNLAIRDTVVAAAHKSVEFAPPLNGRKL